MARSVLRDINDSVHHLPLYFWRTKWGTQVWGPNQSAVQVRSLLVHQKLLPSLEITPFGNKRVKWIPEVMLWEWLETEWNEWCERHGQPVWPHEANQGDIRSALLIFIGFLNSEGVTSTIYLKPILFQPSVCKWLLIFLAEYLASFDTWLRCITLILFFFLGLIINSQALSQTISSNFMVEFNKCLHWMYSLIDWFDSISTTYWASFAVDSGPASVEVPICDVVFGQSRQRTGHWLPWMSNTA